MGILSWWKGDKASPELKPKIADDKQPDIIKEPQAVDGMNGAVEVPGMRLADITVFEFGSVAASSDKVTLSGYCPVSEEFLPCRWEITPAAGDEAPQFRVVF